MIVNKFAQQVIETLDQARQNDLRDYFSQISSGNDSILHVMDIKKERGGVKEFNQAATSLVAIVSNLVVNDALDAPVREPYLRDTKRVLQYGKIVPSLAEGIVKTLDQEQIKTEANRRKLLTSVGALTLGLVGAHGTLWSPDEISYVLKNNRGNLDEALRGLSQDYFGPLFAIVRKRGRFGPKP